MGVGMTGKVGPGGDVKASRLLVSCIVLPRPIELHYCINSFAFPVLGGLVS